MSRFQFLISVLFVKTNLSCKFTVFLNDRQLIGSWLGSQKLKVPTTSEWAKPILTIPWFWKCLFKRKAEQEIWRFCKYTPPPFPSIIRVWVGDSVEAQCNGLLQSSHSSVQAVLSSFWCIVVIIKPSAPPHPPPPQNLFFFSSRLLHSDSVVVQVSMVQCSGAQKKTSCLMRAGKKWISYAACTPPWQHDNQKKDKPQIFSQDGFLEVKSDLWIGQSQLGGP